MKVVVTGTRGIPDILGGVETHCEELFPRISDMGIDVTVIRRSCYVSPENRRDRYKGVSLVDVYAPRRKSLEAIVHTFLAIVKARRLNADIVHIHAIGPSLMAPLARLLGMKVVTTHHGPDYDRKKWGFLAKTMLKAGEWCGAHFSNEVIVISQVISDILRTKHHRTSNLIYNGVTPPVRSSNTDYIESLGLTSGKYVVAVGRFVKEKCFDMLIDAFTALNPEGYKLVIAGDADHPDDFSEMLKDKARRSGTVLTGFIRGERLNQILTNAALFVLPSTHEGLPISLLEAMSYGLDVLVSDIPANRLPQLAADDMFLTGNVDALREALRRKLANTQPRTYDLAPYNWDNIARQTVDVYLHAIEG
ncbi:MAG: glycosyltransferase family 4 protein [Muribaculaceae bacterium]|nr:glycosyltransferase family 4 protein [Muribaculaceae bacterium]